MVFRLIYVNLLHHVILLWYHIFCNCECWLYSLRGRIIISCTCKQFLYKPIRLVLQFGPMVVPSPFSWLLQTVPWSLVSCLVGDRRVVQKAVAEKSWSADGPLSTNFRIPATVYIVLFIHFACILRSIFYTASLHLFDLYTEYCAFLIMAWIPSCFRSFHMITG